MILFNPRTTQWDLLDPASQQLLRETVRFVQAMFDHYKYDVVSVMPPDGYTAICQCELCEGKGQPERGWRGQFSNYVWEYIDAVAREVYKSHPDKMVSAVCYGSYRLPPRHVDLERLRPDAAVD